jgi:hypothetical protein
MIVLTIVLTVAAVVMVAGYYIIIDYETVDDDHRCMVTVNMSSPSLVRDDTNTLPTWELTSNVIKVTPKNEKIRYSKVRVTIDSWEGSLMVERAVPMPEDPTGDSQDGGIVQIWYSGNNKNGRLDAGDVVRISGITTDYEGALVQFFDQTEGSGRIVADLLLPLEFSEDP